MTTSDQDESMMQDSGGSELYTYVLGPRNSTEKWIMMEVDQASNERCFIYMSLFYTNSNR